MEKDFEDSFGKDGLVAVELPTTTILWQKDKSDRGILIYATGNQYYIDCAVRLAAGIKCMEPTMRIALATDLEIADPAKLFDFVLPVPQEHLYQGKKRMDIRAKIFAAELSPFTETLMLDADMLWLPKKKPSQFFDSMKDADFFIQNTGFADLSLDEVDNQVYYVWAKISEVKADYDFIEGRFYQYTGEWLFWKKTQPVLDWFATVQQVYDNCKVKNIVAFANQTCNDELAYAIASVLTGLYPATSPLVQPKTNPQGLPVYWPWRSELFKNKIGAGYLKWADEFYAFSLGGNQTTSTIKIQYEALVQGYFYKLSISADYQLRDKRRVMPERRNI